MSAVDDEWEWLDLWVPVLFASWFVIGVGFGSVLIAAAEGDHGHVWIGLIEIVIGTIGILVALRVLTREEKK